MLQKRFVSVIVLGVLGLAVSACDVADRLRGGTLTAGLPYSARLSPGDDPRDFSVTVAADGASLQAARESARLPATRHCIEYTRRSDVDWVIDPATNDWQVTRGDNGSLQVRGRCRYR